jgi:hypothetical protein
MKRLLDRRWGVCLLVVVAALVGAGADKALQIYDYNKLKAAGYPVDRNGDITYWAATTPSLVGQPTDKLVGYSVVNVPTVAGKPPRRFVIQLGEVRKIHPNNTNWLGIVASTPNNDGSLRSAGAALDEQHPDLDMLQDKDAFVKKYGKVKLKDGWMIESSKVGVTPPDEAKPKQGAAQYPGPIQFPMVVPEK